MTYNEYIKWLSDIDKLHNAFKTLNGNEIEWRDTMIKAIDIRIDEMSQTEYNGYKYDDDCLKAREKSVKNLKAIKTALNKLRLIER